MENKNTTPRKRPLLKALKGLFNIPIVRGLIKTVPGGNLGYEIADTVKYYIDKRKGNVDAQTPPPHNAVSQLLQLIGIAAIVYAFLNRWITVEDLLRFLNTFGTIDPTIITPTP